MQKNEDWTWILVRELRNIWKMEKLKKILFYSSHNQNIIVIGFLTSVVLKLGMSCFWFESINTVSLKVACSYAAHILKLVCTGLHSTRKLHFKIMNKYSCAMSYFEFFMLHIHSQRRKLECLLINRHLFTMFPGDVWRGIIP